jgi:hypothetical protein
MESALWASARGFEQAARLARDLAARASDRGHGHSAALFRRREDEAEGYLDQIYDILAVVTHRPELAAARAERDLPAG